MEVKGGGGTTRWTMSPSSSTVFSRSSISASSWMYMMKKNMIDFKKKHSKIQCIVNNNLKRVYGKLKSLLTLSVIRPTLSICPVCRGRRTFYRPRTLFFRLSSLLHQYQDLWSQVILMSIILRVVRWDGQRQKQEEPDWHLEPNWLLRTDSTDCHCLLQTQIVKQPIHMCKHADAHRYKPGLMPKKH